MKMMDGSDETLNEEVSLSLSLEKEKSETVTTIIRDHSIPSFKKRKIIASTHNKR